MNINRRQRQAEADRHCYPTNDELSMKIKTTENVNKKFLFDFAKNLVNFAKKMKLPVC